MSPRNALRPRNDLGQYVDLVDEWWRPDGALEPLKWLAAARADLIPHADRPGAVLVDLGCGGGLMAPHMTSHGYRHVGLDMVGSNLRLAAEHGVEPVLGDAMRVPLRADCADVVVAGELLEHVAEPEAVIAEAARLLRPGGLLVGDTIANTLTARWGIVGVAEWIGTAPRGIHDPNLFVAPSRVVAASRDSGMTAQVRGVRPATGDVLRWMATRTGSVRMVPTRSLSGLYQFRAMKSVAAPARLSKEAADE